MAAPHAVFTKAAKTDSVLRAAAQTCGAFDWPMRRFNDRRRLPGCVFNRRAEIDLGQRWGLEEGGGKTPGGNIP